MWRSIAAGETWRGRVVNRKKDGTLYHEEMTISPVLDQECEIANYVAVKRDITEQLRIHEERLELEKQFHAAQRMEAIGRLAADHLLERRFRHLAFLGERGASFSEARRDGFRARWKQSCGVAPDATFHSRDLAFERIAYASAWRLDLRVSFADIFLGFAIRFFLYAL